MISAFGIDHGEVSKARLGFVDLPRVEHEHHPQPVADVAHEGVRAVKGARRMRGKLALVTAAGAAGASGAGYALGRRKK